MRLNSCFWVILVQCPLKIKNELKGNKMNRSVWSDSIKLPEFQTLHDDIHTDVLIIGGGLCGILCAFALKQAGVDYALAEGNTIGCGITMNTTAKITSQHGLIYRNLIESAGSEKARLYLRANELALDKYRELAQNIDCDFEEKDAYIYSMADDLSIKAEVNAVKSLGFPAEFITTPHLPFPTQGAIKFPRQAQFHPLKFIAEIAKGLNIYEHTFIRSVSGHTAQSNVGNITANKIIVTTHFPFINGRGSYFLKLYQHRSYVIALQNASDMDGMYLDEASGGMSFRNYKDLLLIGGGSHRTGKPGGSWQELRLFARKYFPEAAEKYSWATQDCMSLDNIPYIGHYSLYTPDLYVAAGFHKWGMTSSMLSSMLLCDMVTGKENEWREVFSPHRNMLKPQLMINGFEATRNLLTPSAKRCPHLGCALKWNEAEHTWDCPCHGSRFQKDGDLIDNPAKHGL